MRSTEALQRTRWPKLSQRIALLMLPVFLWGAVGVAQADESPDERPIYESLDGVKIGRVFLSRGERARLDATRHLEPGPNGPAVTGPLTEAEETADPPEGYGFIQVTGKAPRVFRDGDFVRARVSSSGVDALPPGVVVRHEEPATDGGENQ